MLYWTLIINLWVNNVLYSKTLLITKNLDIKLTEGAFSVRALAVIASMD